MYVCMYVCMYIYQMSLIIISTEKIICSATNQIAAILIEV